MRCIRNWSKTLVWDKTVLDICQFQKGIEKDIANSIDAEVIIDYYDKKDRRLF